MRSIPPIHLLATLDALMRLRSFRRAADELHLSHSTVSHRLRELEQLLGMALFERSTRSVAPTPAAEHLHQQIKGALRTLEAAFGERHPTRAVVRISALPSFARLRLLPALPRLMARPGAPEVEIHPSLQLDDVDKGEADVAIRFSAQPPQAHHCERLMDDAWFPVATRAYLDMIDAPASPAALRHATLLGHTRQGWQDWLDAAGVALSRRRRTLQFSDTGLLIDAALAGQGIALARRSLVGAQLANGALVRLSDTELPCAQSYYLLASERACATPAGQAVLDWVRTLAG